MSTALCNHILEHRETRHPRIAAIVSYFPTQAEPHAGMPFFNQMQAMSALCPVDIFVVRPKYPEVPVLRPKNFASKTVDVNFTIPGMDVVYVTYPALPVLSRPFNGDICANRVLPRVRAVRPDIILSYIIYPEAYAAVSIARRLKVPVVVGATGSDVRCIPDAWTRRLVKRTLREADFIVTKSSELSEQVISLGAAQGKVRPILNGCDGAIFSPGDRSRARARLGVEQRSKLVVFTGRLVAVKGLGELLLALRRLHDSGDRVEAALIGDGPLEFELRQRCAELNLSGSVHFLGSRSPEEIAEWLRASDLFCLPSYSEGCPNVVLEALACGRPVVATKVGGVPEIVDSGCGILVPPRDPEGLAAGIRQALTADWNEAAISRSNGRTWNDVAKETLTVCRMVLSANHRRDR